MTTCTSARFARRCRTISRDVAAAALWRVFPSASEHELIHKAAPVLGTSPDTIRRIARRETDAKLSLVLPILVMDAASRGIDLIEAIGAD